MNSKKFSPQTVKLVGFSVFVVGFFGGLWWFQQVNVNGADLRLCKNLTRVQITQVFTNEKTIWPDYLDPPTKS